MQLFLSIIMISINRIGYDYVEPVCQPRSTFIKHMIVFLFILCTKHG